MKLNNKGFAASIILYSIVAIIIVVLLLILAVNAANVHNKTSLGDSIKENIATKTDTP